MEIKKVTANYTFDVIINGVYYTLYIQIISKNHFIINSSYLYKAFHKDVDRLEKINRIEEFIKQNILPKLYNYFDEDEAVIIYDENYCIHLDNCIIRKQNVNCSKNKSCYQ